MATKKTPVPDEDALSMVTSDAAFDQAVDDLRGVLKSDSEGTLPDFGSDFSASPMDTADLSAFEPDLGGYPAAMPAAVSDFGTDTFGGDFDDAPLTTQPQPGSALTGNLNLIMDIPIDVEVILGASKMPVAGLMNLEEGAIITLDRKIGEPVDITVNGRRIARGEITVLENDDTRFGVKLIEVMGSKTT
ncbi:flagellar motor switch protein FliN [Ciceribacter azotifigens]|uniref:flagellar motor switch protein FliN n=1 Tax=Ciceribacter azotifigens TaxID=2069303 RepID=UPI003A8813F3